MIARWLDEKEHALIGNCRGSAADFDQMTPREVQWRIDGEQERENRQFERLAQLACWVVNPWMDAQNRMSVRTLLKRRMPGKRTDWDAWAKD